MDSLKNLLYNKIKQSYPNTYSLDNCYIIAKEAGQKQATCDRRLRELCESEESRIKPVRNNKGYITGYVWIRAKETRYGAIRAIKQPQNQRLPMRLTRITD